MKFLYALICILFSFQFFIYSNSHQEQILKENSNFMEKPSVYMDSLSVENKEKAFKQKNFFSLGLISSADSIKTSINIEMGFTIFSTDKFQIRSITSIAGSKIYDDEPQLYQLGLMEKITFGQNETSVINQEKGFEIIASRYGFFFTSFGFMAFDKNRESKFLFSSPYYWEIGGGAGLNLRLTQIVAFVAEVGGGLHIINDGKEDFIKKLQKAGFGRMSLGFRYFIK